MTLKIRFFPIFSILLLLSFISKASKIDTVTTFSNIMNKKIKAIVVTPDNYDKMDNLPVVYLLHGYGDSYDGWVKKGAGFEKNADLHNIIIVCPDGNFSSWYWDSPTDKNWQYDTYVSKELVPYIDQHYKTKNNRNGRAITGLSMGGHGALYLGITHQDVFGAAGSMSGGVDIRSFPNNWEMAKRLGEYAENPEIWEKYSVINQLYKLKPNSMALIIDCGVDDFFYRVNEKLHQELVYKNIPHDYITRPGGHTWPYWKNAVQYQMLYFSNYFNTSAK